MAKLSDFDFRCLSLNVRGISNQEKRTAIFRWIKHQKADIVLLQETYSNHTDEASWDKDWGYKNIYLHGTKHSCGLMVLFNDTLDIKIIDINKDQQGRYILLKAEIQGTEFYILNIYAPNKHTEQIDCFQRIKALLVTEDISDESFVIMGGDFNVTLNPELDKSGGKYYPQSKNVQKLNDLLNTLNLQDIWRVQHEQIRRYTWRQKKPLIQCRLDYWFTQETLQDFIQSTTIIPSIRSDHSAIMLHLKNYQIENKGPNYWKFNNSLLDDSNYVRFVTQHLNNWVLNDTEDKRIVWEILKYNIRVNTIYYSKNKHKKKKDYEDTLNKELNKIDESLACNPSEELLKQKDEILEEIKNIEDYKIQGAAVRSRERWFEEGEKSSKYFFSLEKSNAKKTHIRKLKTNNNTYTVDQKNILDMQKTYYKSLYEQKETKDRYDDLFLDIDSNILSDASKQVCEGKLSLEECTKAVNEFQNNKSPGNDGLTAEFYKYFWPKLGNYFIECFNSVYEKGELTTSQKQAIIKLLEKKGKDRTYLKNWRPISLLNVDYKIASKALANRIKKVLPELISISQSAYVQGRYIGDALRTIQDLMDFSDSRNLPGLLLCIDFEKAFDSVSWNFLNKTLHVLNFGESFKKWIRIMYTDISSCIINNGLSTGYFTIGRGVRQGDPMSAYLFILITELLTRSINKNKNIKGINIGNEEIKLVQYADDTTLFLKDTRSAEKVFDLLKYFEECSGLKINFEKTEGMWIGTKKDSNETPLNITWKKELKILGIYFSYDKNESYNLNYRNKLDQLEKTLNLWKMRKLSLIGKILIVKTLGLSKFIYTASVTDVPDEIYDKVDKLLYSFIWNNKPAKIKKKTLIGQYEQGGLKAPHFRAMVNAQRAFWIKKYINCHDALWKTILDYNLKDYGGTFLCYCNYNADEIGNISSFYQDCFRQWKLILKYINYRQEKCHQMVFNNENIKINGRSVFFCDFKDIGLWTTKDIYDKGKIQSFNFWKSKGISNRQYLHWRGLIDAIPRSYKMASKQDMQMDDTLKLTENKSILDAESRDFYKILLQEIYKQPTAEKYYINVPKEDWEQFYILPWRILFDSETISFQYKFINRILATKHYLKKINKISSENCTFCKTYPETFEHLFYDCHYTSIFWNDVVTQMLSRLSIDSINHQDLALGILDTNNFETTNTILIIAKKYIWQTKMKDIIPTYHSFERYMKSYMQDEKRVFEKLKKGMQFREKWMLFLDVMIDL